MFKVNEYLQELRELEFKRLTILSFGVSVFFWMVAGWVVGMSGSWASFSILGILALLGGTIALHGARKEGFEGGVRARGLEYEMKERAKSLANVAALERSRDRSRNRVGGRGGVGRKGRA